MKMINIIFFKIVSQCVLFLYNSCISLSQIKIVKGKNTINYNLIEAILILFSVFDYFLIYFY